LKQTVVEFLAIGRIVKAHGTRGDVVVRPLTDMPDRFRKLRAAYLGVSAETARRVQIDRAAVEVRGVRLHIAGVPDRTEAARLTGHYLFVDRAQRIRLPKGRHFVHEIIGLTVVDQNGAVLGTVRDVMKMPAQDVYVITDGAREFMIPAVKEFILELDTTSRQVRVKLIEGMLEGG